MDTHLQSKTDHSCILDINQLLKARHFNNYMYFLLRFANETYTKLTYSVGWHPGLVISYNIQPGNGLSLFYHKTTAN